MSVNKIYQDTEHKRRVIPVVTQTVPGTPLIWAGQSWVTITAENDATATKALSDGTSITYSLAAVGYKDLTAGAAQDGTWEFAVTGATTGTLSGVPVYLTGAGVLTLTATDNDFYGVTDYPPDYRKKAGRAPVRIGDNYDV